MTYVNEKSLWLGNCRNIHEVWCHLYPTKKKSHIHTCLNMYLYCVCMVNIQKKNWTFTILRGSGIGVRGILLYLDSDLTGIGCTTDKLLKSPGGSLSFSLVSYLLVPSGNGDLCFPVLVWSPSALPFLGLTIQKSLSVPIPNTDGKDRKGSFSPAWVRCPFWPFKQGAQADKMTKGDYLHFTLEKDEARPR